MSSFTNILDVPKLSILLNDAPKYINVINHTLASEMASTVRNKIYVVLIASHQIMSLISSILAIKKKLLSNFHCR